ncbi:MAG: prepilin-type N-terminal cleavage/methylation domain-containing protein [Clostridia bacterium]|nr:prepilin-type N-terminal cleavage/methylation domain-containing protein [Clostridia bacterium]
MLKRMKDKKGFTLVEVIVVLIIIAMLAVILVPQLTGYINKANDRVILAEAHAAVMAANTLYAEYVADNAAGFPSEAEIAKLAELDVANISYTTAGDALATLTYAKNGKKVTYDYSGHSWGSVSEVGSGSGD